MFKNLHQIRQVVQWNHHCFPDGWLVHTNKSCLYHLTIPPLSPSAAYCLSPALVDLRTDNSLDSSIGILSICCSPLQPHLVSLSTTQGVLLLGVNSRIPLSSVLFNPSFSSNLPVEQAKSIVQNNKVIPLTRLQQSNLL